MTYAECLLLINRCLNENIFQRDPEDCSRMLVVREISGETRWCSQDILSVADELAENPDSQQELLKALENNGYQIEI